MEGIRSMGTARAADRYSVADVSIAPAVPPSLDTVEAFERIILGST
jgi:hypothetical protein